MPFRYLLDTNILSELMRHPQGEIAQQIASRGEDSVCTSIRVTGVNKAYAEAYAFVGAPSMSVCAAVGIGTAGVPANRRSSRTLVPDTREMRTGN